MRISHFPNIRRVIVFFCNNDAYKTNKSSRIYLSLEIIRRNSISKHKERVSFASTVKLNNLQHIFILMRAKQALESFLQILNLTVKLVKVIPIISYIDYSCAQNPTCRHTPFAFKVHGGLALFFFGNSFSTLYARTYYI